MQAMSRQRLCSPVSVLICVYISATKRKRKITVKKFRLVICFGLLALALVFVALSIGNRNDRTLMNELIGVYKLPDSVFGNTSYTRDSIASITFLDTLDGMPSDAWDVSARKNKNIMAWATANGSLFDLYIGSNGPIIGNRDCGNLFASFKNATVIDLGNNFDTANVTYMHGMFNNCAKLESLRFDQREVLH